MLRNIFGIEKPVIGMVHLGKLAGQRGFKGLDHLRNKAVRDAVVLEKGGIDGICVENWEDNFLGAFTSISAIVCIERATEEITKTVNVPVGINILPNDYRAAFKIARELLIRFIWLDVFVDKVRTDYSYSSVTPFEVEVDYDNFKKHRGTQEALLFASIHPKHYTMLEKDKTIETSAKQAMNHGADAIVITKLTGVAPDLEFLKRVKRFVGDFPVLLGSGLTPENAESLLPIVDGAIVGTAVKDKSFDHVVKRKVKKLMEIVKELRS